MKKILALGACIMAFLLASCSSVEDLGRFTIISSKNVDLSRLGEMQKMPEKTETKKYNARFLFINYSKISDSYVLENALDSALESIPGAVALIDARVQLYHSKGFLGITEKWGYRFEGTAIVDSDILGKTEVPTDNGTIFIISNESNGDIAFVTENEFNSALNGMVEL